MWPLIVAQRMSRLRTWAACMVWQKSQSSESKVKVGNNQHNNFNTISVKVICGYYYMAGSPSWGIPRLHPCPWPRRCPHFPRRWTSWVTPKSKTELEMETLKTQMLHKLENHSELSQMCHCNGPNAGLNQLRGCIPQSEHMRKQSTAEVSESKPLPCPWVSLAGQERHWNQESSMQKFDQQKQQQATKVWCTIENIVWASDRAWHGHPAKSPSGPRWLTSAIRKVVTSLKSRDFLSKKPSWIRRKRTSRQKVEIST